MPVTIPYPANVKCNENGFVWLAKVAHRLEPLWGDNVVFDARHLRFFDGNLCAPFGALLQDALDNQNTISLGAVSGNVLELWQKNGFVNAFGGVKTNDFFDTTLIYRRFELAEEPQRFAAYMKQELLSKDLPQMADDTREEFSDSIKELFDNSQTHSASKSGIFLCGQFFPTRERLAFNITDLGIGFRQNVVRKTAREWNDAEAIDWATQRGHSTRSKGQSGYGLWLLKEFCKRNGGRLQIVSQCGYWESDAGQIRSKNLAHPFPGSFVNLEINTLDEEFHDFVGSIANDPLF